MTRVATAAIGSATTGLKERVPAVASIFRDINSLKTEPAMERRRA